MMKRSLLPLALLSGYANVQSLDYPSVWQCDANRPNWYRDMEDARPQPVQPTPAPARQQTSRKADQSKRIELEGIKTTEQLRQELKHREDMAVMNPADQNMKNYLELWRMTQDEGAVFADSWWCVVWQNPSLDYAQRRPIDNSVIEIYDKGRIQNEERRLRMLAKEYGLIFFFHSDCPYYRAMAPTLKTFSDKYGIEVLPVSVGGMGLPESPNPCNGRAQAAAWGIERVPALFTGSKQTDDRALVDLGMMALTEIANRIFILAGIRPGGNF